MKTFAFCFMLCIAAFAQAQTSVTAKQLYTEFKANFTAAKAKYEGQNLQVSNGKIRHKTVAFGEVYLMITTNDFDSYIEFILPDNATNRALEEGSLVTVNGTLSRIFAGSTGKIQFNPCTLVSTGSAPVAKEEKQPSKPAPKDMPMGAYSVYQGGNFQYVYRIRFSANGKYVQFDSDAGTYKYNSKTKVINFLSGPLAGFTGLYYTKGRNNDKGEPMIAIDWDGKVPNLSEAYNGQYQYAIYQGGK
jgi:hypothetical protein